MPLPPVSAIAGQQGRVPNTLGLPCRAMDLRVVSSPDELPEVWAQARRHGRSTTTARDPLVLGGCSNVVLPGQIDGTVLLMRNRGFLLEPENDGLARLTVGAGECWHDVVRRTLGQGYGGLENLALIPGSVGAAPIQNIGAYGVELADRLLSVEVFDPERAGFAVLDREACRFGYRDSIFKQPAGSRLVVIRVTLSVARRPTLVLDYPDLTRELAAMGCSRPTPVAIAEAVIRVRRRKLPDPRHVGNVGSFFKNPVLPDAAWRALALREPGLVHYPAGPGRVKLAAGQLIERCGWRGVRRGPAGVWPRQALVLINHGSAVAADILALADAIRDDVRARFGIELEPEPRILRQD